MIAESSTYQKILRDGLRKGRRKGLQEGQILGERLVLKDQGTKRFGEPDAAILAVIDAIHDPDRLRALCLRMLDADIRTWSDLLRDV